MIRPWGPNLAVTDPPADPQDGTHSGIVLPPGTGLDVLNRGIVDSFGPDVPVPQGFGSGAVVWYRNNDGLVLGADGSLKIIDHRQIVAWEEA